MTKKVFALVDCNNFYVSCERVFNPKLNDVPVMVLSNNDGCVVARSDEVKELGVKMAAPAYKYRDLIRKHSIEVYSANFSLYADMSRRVMDTLCQLVPDVEVYSIDEAFLDFSKLEVKSYTEFARKIKQTVEQWTGIPISIGIASTKTLTKIANKVAKRDSDHKGVFDLGECSDIDLYLSRIKVIEIWGVGRQSAKLLNTLGIRTAKDLKYADEKLIKKRTSVLGQRTVLELNGVSCMSMEHTPAPRRSISSTRTFGGYVEDLEDLKEAVANFVSIAAEKLRSQKSVASCITVFIRTNMFANHAQYSNSAVVNIFKPTSFTPELIKCAHRGLRSIYREGFKYRKAGVVLTGIEQGSEGQLDMFCSESSEEREKQSALMDLIDRINRKWGVDTVKIAAQGIDPPWRSVQSRKSGRYTTRWEEIGSVGAG